MSSSPHGDRSRSCRGLVAALAALAVVALGVTPALGANLIVNPGAEDAPGAADASSVVPIPGWQTESGLTAVRYGQGGFPAAAESARIGGGANFFAGGPGTPASIATQSVDVNAFASRIDAGTARVALTALVGGFGGQEDSAMVTAIALDAAGGEVAFLTTLLPATDADRGGQSIFLPRCGAAAVPPGTRRIEVVISTLRAAGDYNDGYVDNVSLDLDAPGCPVTLGAVAPTSGLPGSLVTLTGSGFGDTQGSSQVTISGLPAGVVSWSDTEIEALVPNSLPGAAEVRVVVGGVTSDPQPFTVTAAPAQAPFATAIAVPVTGATVLFDATLSLDPDGTLGMAKERGGKGELQLTGGLRVNWNFGDGTSSKNAVVMHTYSRPGDYSVKLTVTDRSNKSSTVTQSVAIPRPTGFVVTPSGRRIPTYAPGRVARVVPVNISLPSQVVFDIGSATLRRESRAFLLRVARIVKRSRKVTRVAGYTDSTGSTEFNQMLSTQRARAVRAFLVRQGRLRAPLLRAVGFGERFPITSNATELGRQKNRRVVLRVVFPVGVRRF